MLARFALMYSALLVASCDEKVALASATEPSLAQPAPAGVASGAGGFATITDVAPAPFTPAEPEAAKPKTREQLAGDQRFTRVTRFQGEVMDEVQALAATLRARERGNFVDLYFENEGEPHVVFRFLRDPEKTLAKYTNHPRFFARSARFTDRELEAAMDFMLETFREDRVVLGGGTGNKRNRAVVEIGVTEPEFRALVTRKGVTIPEGVELHFAAARPASEINRPLPPNVARLLRIFARDNRPTGALHAVNSTAKVVLQDGCFRIAGGEDDGAHVLFPLGAQLFIDQAGHLAFGAAETPGYARVGETIITPGTIGEVTSPDLVAPIRKACGPGKVVKVHGMRSAAADRAQGAVAANASALRHFRDEYGLSEPVARKVLEGCKARSGFGVCHIAPPSPPPPGGPNCPAGTKAISYVCRTPEGYVRPIPDWVQELAGQGS